jgi:hypothetical protein
MQMAIDAPALVVAVLSRGLMIMAGILFLVGILLESVIVTISASIMVVLLLATHVVTARTNQIHSPPWRFQSLASRLLSDNVPNPWSRILIVFHVGVGYIGPVIILLLWVVELFWGPGLDRAPWR